MKDQIRFLPPDNAPVFVDYVDYIHWTPRKTLSIIKCEPLCFLCANQAALDDLKYSKTRDKLMVEATTEL